VGWRGDGTGRYPDAQPVTQWAKDKAVLWSTPLPSWSNASPILVGDRLFVCSEPSTLFCVAAADGKILWQKSNDYFDTLSPELAEKVRAALKLSDQLNALVQQSQRAPEKVELYDRIAEVCKQISADPGNAELLAYRAKFQVPATHETNGYSSPTPTSDGRFVYALFGTGVVACYDLDGNRRWVRAVNKSRDGYGHGASPLLADGKLLVHVDVQVTALDAATGEVLWQVNAPWKWGSPAHARIGDVDAAVTPAGDVLRVSDGRKLAGGLGQLVYSTPVVIGDLVYFIDGEQRARLLRLPGSAAADGGPQGRPAADEVKPEVLWDVKIQGDRYYGSPLVHEGLIYTINQRNHFSVLDAANGAKVYERALELGNGTVFPSITLGGRYVFVSTDNGATFVLEPGREYKEVARNTLEPFRTTPVFAGSRMYVRGLKNLWCVGQ
jgi:outer membrane protein assembly factor BamB